MSGGVFTEAFRLHESGKGGGFGVEFESDIATGLHCEVLSERSELASGGHVFALHGRRRRAARSRATGRHPMGWCTMPSCAGVNSIIVSDHDHQRVGKMMLLWRFLTSGSFSQDAGVAVPEDTLISLSGALSVGTFSQTRPWLAWLTGSAAVRGTASAKMSGRGRCFNIGRGIRSSDLRARRAASICTRMEHHVYFWLSEEHQNAADRAKFEQALDSLLKSELPSRGCWSVPAKVEIRPVSEMSWDYALSMQFASVEDHDVYQDEPNHHVFINGFKSWWAKVQVMDLA